MKSMQAKQCDTRSKWSSRTSFTLMTEVVLSSRKQVPIYKEHRVTFQKIVFYVHWNISFNANETTNKTKYISNKSLRLHGIPCGCLSFICLWRSQFRLVLCGQYWHCRWGSLPHSSWTCLYKVLFHRYNLPQEVQPCPTDDRYRFAICQHFCVRSTDRAHMMLPAEQILQELCSAKQHLKKNQEPYISSYKNNIIHQPWNFKEIN